MNLDDYIKNINKFLIKEDAIPAAEGTQTQQVVNVSPETQQITPTSEDISSQLDELKVNFEAFLNKLESNNITLEDIQNMVSFNDSEEPQQA
jgi:predicted  nucleic acid-binding Zn-ribbon protein